MKKNQVLRVFTGAVSLLACLTGTLAFSADSKTSVQLPDTVQNITLPNGNTVQVTTGVKVEAVDKKNDAPKIARKTAILVNNHAGPQLNESVPRFEDHVAVRIAGEQFEVLSREDIQKSLKMYAVNGGSVAQALADGERNALGSAEDRALTDGTSALRLAQNLDADYLLIVTIESFSAETKRYKANDLDVQNKVFTLRGTYKLLDGITGGAIGGMPVRASKIIRESQNISTENTDVTAALVESLADQVAEDLLRRGAGFRESASAVAAAANPSVPTSEVPVVIRCQARDLQGNEISLPDIAMTEDNLVVKGTNYISLQVAAVVSVNGVVVGSSPTQLRLRPGMHKLRLTRPGFDDVEMTVKASEGMDLTVTMQMSADGFKRWQEIRKTLNDLDVSRKLTDAEAERLRGLGQMFRQSGYRLEDKSDVKIDAKELPSVKIYRSIF